MGPEAQIVLTCMQQAVRDSDRLAMELWLEQAENINIERLHLSEEPILLIVREYIEDFEDVRERQCRLWFLVECVVDVDS